MKYLDKNPRNPAIDAVRLSGPAQIHSNGLSSAGDDGDYLFTYESGNQAIIPVAVLNRNYDPAPNSVVTTAVKVDGLEPLREMRDLLKEIVALQGQLKP